MQHPHSHAAGQTRVAVYRGPAACDGCPESAADLFESAWDDVDITYVGPKEDVDISKKSLKDFDVSTLGQDLELSINTICCLLACRV